MIELEADLPAHVIVATARGKVTADDYAHVLIPAVDAAAGGGAKVRLMYVLGSDFDGFAAEAALDDGKLGMHHWRDFERIAVVSDREAYRIASRALGFLIPGEVKVFSNADQQLAREWVAAD